MLFAFPVGRWWSIRASSPLLKARLAGNGVGTRNGPRDEPARFTTFAAKQALSNAADRGECVSCLGRHGYAAENGGHGCARRRCAIRGYPAFQPKPRVRGGRGGALLYGEGQI